ncbi:NERD domain-containing protein [Roseibium sp.]|uniref:nuclease-related domain-containing DEAD/DEAH box helicase n=1 Tax=Roseibium sp. TaxID=1936156 RepID=UPI003A975C02
MSNSDAELRLLSALEKQLADDFSVLHSVAWIGRPNRSVPLDGEIDLLVCHPRFGILVIEVKGGRISLDYRSGKWTSTDRFGNSHDIKNPFEQAKKGKFGILEKLKECPAWQKLGIRYFNIGHAAFFPDIGNANQLRGPDAPPELIGDRNDMGTLGDWVKGAFQYWRGETGGRLENIGESGVTTVVRLFARVTSTRALLSARIEDEEVQRIELTRKQAAILDFLRRQRRVLITGGAGTGKTLIAMEKAIRNSDEGIRTLLVCFNRGLADHLREQCENVPNLDVASFHQVCHRWIEKVRNVTHRDLLVEARQEYPGADEFGQLMPIALANAIDLLGPKYDAVIVDEGQDFGDEFWLPIEMLLVRPEEGMLYVFLDENQDIYGRSAEIPIAGEPMVLDRNCRNTDVIHAGAYRYYRGSLVEPPEIRGVPIETLCANGPQKQARLVAKLLTRLVAEEGVRPHDIAVLLGERRSKAVFERELRAMPLPAIARLGRLEDYGPGVITLETIARFKGLERPIIVLWAIDDLSVDRDRESYYVGMSRAKSALYLCGSRETCERILQSDVLK